MAAITVQFHNADRKPLDDVVDVEVTATQSGVRVSQQKSFSGKKKLKVANLTAGQTYMVRAFPMRHRPVGQFTFAPPGDEAENVTLFCPVDPDRVSTPAFPAFAAVALPLRTVLERSTLEKEAGSPAVAATPGATPGESLFNGLEVLPKAGLLNIFCKMSVTPLGGSSCWDFVNDVYRVRGDRIFANVAIDLRDKVKTAVAGKVFDEADDSLHKPPLGFERAGSFKTKDKYGNLQLSFFASIDTPLRFRIDADIDDAAGIEHAFQVLDHHLTGDETHPYDIREILAFHQRLNVGYELPV